MKKHSKLAKFFIICAAVFFVGLICTIAGIVTGGPQGIEKLADRYDWIQGSPGERGVTGYPAKDYHSIEVTGDADLLIIGPAYYKKASWQANQDLLEPTEMDEIGENRVAVICGDKVPQPEVTVNNGVLTINAGAADFSGISLNTSEGSWYPKILVFVPNEVLESLDVSGQTGDVDILGVSWERAKVELNSGDISIEGVSSGSLVCETDAGDMELQGKLMGTTDVHAEAGDIEIDTSLAKAEYSLEAKSAAGELTVKEADKILSEEEMNALSLSGGPHKIIAGTSSGDVEISFAAEL